MRRRACLCGTAAVLGMLALAPGASAAVFPVDTTVDGEDAFTGDTTCATLLNRCTLRAAIEQANAQGGPDQVNLPPGTYVLGPLGELPISSDIVVEGTGTSSNTVVRPNINGRIFNVSSAGSLDLRDATVRNGVLAANGGGILSSGSLVLRRVAVTNNQAFGEDGGGIFATGRVAIADSAIASNRAVNGGGVMYLGTGGDSLSIARSTLSVNRAEPAANPTDGFGGGLLAGPNTQVRLANSTLNGNRGRVGGGISVSTDMTLDHVTLAANSGAPAGITTSNQHTITLANTILDNSDGANCSATGTFTSGGGNVESGNDCGLPAADQPSTDPLLGPLASNGGPTRTRAIARNSPARDAVTGGCPPPATDQRGVARPQGPACDSGAFEFDPEPPELELVGKGKQKLKKLTLEVSCGPEACSVELGGKGKVPARAPAAAKSEKSKLKPKGVDIAPGATETVRLKFKRNRATVKKLRALLKQAGSKARKAKVVVSATATGAGGADSAKEKIKLKR
ncbi:MAG: choice-of-anchor Q domain-containing protein [Solirubrobacterales bacterium]